MRRLEDNNDAHQLHILVTFLPSIGGAHSETLPLEKRDSMIHYLRHGVEYNTILANSASRRKRPLPDDRLILVEAELSIPWPPSEELTAVQRDETVPLQEKIKHALLVAHPAVHHHQVGPLDITQER